MASWGPCQAACALLGAAAAAEPPVDVLKTLATYQLVEPGSEVWTMDRGIPTEETPAAMREGEHRRPLAPRQRM